MNMQLMNESLSLWNYEVVDMNYDYYQGHMCHLFLLVLTETVARMSPS